MPLTTEERQEFYRVLEQTGGHRETAKRQRVIPERYKAYQKQVNQKEVVLVLPETAAPVRCVITTALNKKQGCPVHINMHGGGFIFPQDGDDDLYCAHVAAEIQGIVVDIDYATSDKYPFPTALDQSYAVTKWAINHAETWNSDPGKYSIGGHSAGGNLAMAVCLKAARTGEFKLSLQVLDYAASDNAMSVVSGSNPRMYAFSMLYCDGDKEILKNPLASPCFAEAQELSKLPATLIVSAGNCPFTEVNRKLGQRLEAAGVQVTHRVFAESSHGFTVRMSGQWQEAQELIIETIRKN